MVVRRADLPRGSETRVSAGGFAGLSPGDLVFYGGGSDPRVVGLVRDGVPADPAGLAARELPRLRAALEP